MRQTWTACILLSTAVGSSAVTLGRHSGAALIGQPLDVRVQLLVAPEEDPTNQCVTTDVFYGDTQVSPGTVRSIPQKAAGADAQASVRIQSTLPVNEPIVTLYVKAGCSNPFTRRYVLLADLSSEPVASTPVAPPAALAVPVRPPAADSSTPPRTAPARSEAGAGTAGASTRPTPGATGQANARPAVAARPPSVVRRTPLPVAAPRLQLDPVDLDPGIERDPTLKLSPLMLSEPGTSQEARAAAAERWKAINATPEDILRDARKLSTLEAEATELRGAQTRDQASLAELKSQLEQARDQRYSNPLVHALGALLLLALLALLLVWRRKSQAPGSEASRAWWSADPDDKAAADKLGAPAVRPTPTPLPVNNDDKDIDFNLDDDSSFDSLNPPKAGTVRSGRPPLAAEPVPALPTRDKREFSSSAIGGSRSIATEELFDVQQQADFFVSLGEDGQAIEVLRNHLAESHEPSALAYLDLFKLYHRLGRRHDYDQLRDQFNQVFNAGAPPFDHYTDAGRGLEAYETAFSRIQSLWPEPRVLDLIEQSIFRDASDDEVEVFDLEAYRELLLLHAIAKDLIKRDGHASSGNSEFHHTAVQPLKAAGRLLEGSPIAERGMVHDIRERNTQPMDLDAMTPLSSHVGLDVNLDDLSEFSAFEASLPDVDVTIEPTARSPEAEQPVPAAGNLIDFEVQDFMKPEGSDPDKKP